MREAAWLRGVTRFFASVGICLSLVGCQVRESATSAPVPDPTPTTQTRTAKPVAVFRPMAKDLPTRTVILTYHDMVEKRDENSVWFDCTPEELIQQIDWLTNQGAKFVSLDQVYGHLVGLSPISDKAVAICFADNYEGFYRLAWPILREKRIPVTLFVHTDFVGNRQNRPKMTWAQLRELQSSGLVDVQSQTATHPKDLGKLTDTQIQDEMKRSKLALEENLSRPVTMIAYPNGKYDERSKKFAEEAGYLIGFSEKQIPAELSPDIMEIARTVHTKYRSAWRMARRDNLRIQKK
ncbi:MAG: polysaccharide deacetylase family protein [Fimbriimonadaceae bacterium]|nr:polysaccharide deacetylase family protein [Fimbriimonadaceae bacterium]